MNNKILKNWWLVILIIQSIHIWPIRAHLYETQQGNISEKIFDDTRSFNLDILLQEAAAHNNWDLVKVLLAAGANPYFLNEKGQTAFNLAASNGLQSLALMTEEAFRDTQRDSDKRKWPEYSLNTPSGVYGSTLITYAAKVCSVELIREMINAGADITIVNGSGWTLLHCAAVMPGRQEVINELMQAFKKQGYADMMDFKSMHIYKTNYNGHKVIFSENLTALDLCFARLEQDPECPQELVEYQKILLN